MLSGTLFLTMTVSTHLPLLLPLCFVPVLMNQVRSYFEQIAFFILAQNKTAILSSEVADNIIFSFYVMAVLITAMLLFSSGWRYTRSTLSRIHASCIIVHELYFLYTISLIWFLVNADDSPTFAWILYAFGIYGLAYIMMIRFCLVELGILLAQLQYVHPAMIENARDALIEKYNTFSMLLLLVICLFGVDATCLALHRLETPWLPLITFYEISSTLSSFFLLWLFRPRPRTAFFYMEPVASWVDDQQYEDDDVVMGRMERPPFLPTR
jgi:hypothetical protein